MKDRSDPLKEKRLKQLQMYFYLIPWLGTVPALWTIYRQRGDREQQATSRLAVMLAIAWLAGNSLLWMGAMQAEEVLRFRLLFGDTLLTSGYAIACLMLMFRVWRRKSLHLPGFSSLADRVLPKRTS
jgi:hypothetical protein